MDVNVNHAIGQGPSPDEAAAAIAAIERFLADNAGSADPQDAVVSGWLRAALHEGVGSADKESLW